MGPYAKAIIACFLSLLLQVGTDLNGGLSTREMVGNLLVTLGTTAGVYLLPNTKKS